MRQTFNSMERRRKLLISHALEVQVSGETTDIKSDARSTGRERENSICAMYSIELTPPKRNKQAAQEKLARIRTRNLQKKI